MRFLTARTGNRPCKDGARPFAKFLLLGSGLMLLGCQDLQTKLERWVAPPQAVGFDCAAQHDFNSQRRLISQRLTARHRITGLILKALESGNGYYAAAFIQQLVRHAPVSQKAGEYDTATVLVLGYCAGYPDRVPATEAVEQLMAIIGIPCDYRQESAAVRLGMAALGDALRNGSLDNITKARIASFLKAPREVPLPSVAEFVPQMSPCCESASQPGQTRVDSLALRMLNE